MRRRVGQSDRDREIKRNSDAHAARAYWWSQALREALRNMVDGAPEAEITIRVVPGAPRGELLSCLFVDAYDPIIVDVYGSVIEALEAFDSVVARQASVWESVQRAMYPIPEGAFHLFRFGLLPIGVCCIDYRGTHIVAGTADSPDRMRAPRAADVRAVWEAKSSARE